jgi:hypothetical protein
VEPSLRPNRFQGNRQLRRKENSSQGSRRRLRVRSRYRPPSTHWLGNINPIPFRRTGHRRAAFGGAFLSLRVGSPMSNCCSHGTFLHFSLQSSHLNICYYHQDLHQSPFHPGSRPRLRHEPRALLLAGASHSRRRTRIGGPLERHPFSGLVPSAGELLHTP